uniref:RING-type domain-containing protein n=1 Tax=Ditylenchus dipsaci TaxID=166011 RepID=A0A915DKI1_9BILA
MEVQRIQVSGKCLVCFNEFDHQAHSRDNIGTLKCGHIFHFDCVEKLLHQGQKDCIISGWQCEAEDAAEDDVKADVDNEKAVEPGEQQQEEGSSQGSQSKVTKQRGRKRRAKAAPKTKSKKKRSDSPYSATSSVMCMDDIHEDMEEVDAVPVQSASQSSHEDLSKNKHPENGSGDSGEEGLDNNFTLEDNKQAKIFEDSEVKNEVPSRQVSEIQIPNAILPKQSVDNRNGGSERSSITSSALEGAVEGMTVPKEEIDESSAQVVSEKSTISDALICESQHIPEILSQNNTILEVESCSK